MTCSLIKTTGKTVWGEPTESVTVLSHIGLLPDMLLFYKKRSQPHDILFAVGDRLLIGERRAVITKITDYAPRHLEVAFS